MKAVVLGGGTVGVQVAKDLVQEGKDVVLIEKNPEVAQHLSTSLDCMVLEDDGSDLAALKRAVGEDTDHFIAVTGSDEINVIACGIVAQHAPRATKIARIRNPAFGSILASKAFAFAPVDHVVNAEEEAARAILRAIEHGAVGDVIAVGDRSLDLQPVLVTSDSPFARRSVEAIRKMSDAEFLIPLLLRDGEAVIPKGDTQVQIDDTLYFLGTSQALSGLLTSVGEEQLEIRRIAIFGGGRIAERLLEGLTEAASGRQGLVASLFRKLRPRKPGTITVFEQSIDKCKALAERFPSVRVHHADISDEEALFEEELSRYDLVVTLTGSQELNLVTAVQAKLLGVRRSIALVIKNNYVRVARQMHVDVTVCLKDTVARRIVSITRKGTMNTVYAISEAELEILEATVNERSELDGKSLRDAGFSRDALVLYVVRNGSTLMPEGSLPLRIGDQLGILTRKRSINRLEARFRDQQ